MICDKYSVDLKINNIDFELKINFSFLKKLYNLTGRNPFSYLYELVDNFNDDTMHLSRILYTLLDGKLSIKDINFYLIDNEKIKLDIYLQLMRLISLELASENKKDDFEFNEDGNKTEDEINSFISYFNYSYFVAIKKLNMSEEEFYDSSPRILKTMDELNKEYEKNMLLEAYVDIVKSEGKAKKEDKPKMKKNKAKSLMEL